MSQHTLSVLMRNRPGVLARASALFFRRGFDIDSLVVGATGQPGISRMTIVVNVEDQPLERLTGQLDKLVDVLEIVEHEPASAIERELVLLKVRAGGGNRGRILEIVQLFRARTVDVSPEAVTIEATGQPGKLGAMLKMLEPFGIKELVRSGTVAVSRGSHASADRSPRARDRTAA